jgi:hypothetical protein
VDSLHFWDDVLDGLDKVLEVVVKKGLVDFAGVIWELHGDFSDHVDGVLAALELGENGWVVGEVSDDLGDSLGVVSVDLVDFFAVLGLDDVLARSSELPSSSSTRSP